MRSQTEAVSEDLVTQLRDRDPAALDQLLHRYGPEIHAVAYMIVRNQADAEEVTSDTLLTAWRKIGTLRDARRLRSWLLTIATRLALRRQKRSREVMPLLPDMIARRPAEGPDSTDRLALSSAIDGLPPRMRAVVTLHYVADLTVDEVSAATGRSRNTVKSQLREALARLRATLADEGFASDRTAEGGVHE